VIKAVIFDFDVDGTLVDSNDLHVGAWREAFRCYGKELSFEDVDGQMGKGGDHLMPVFCSDEELERHKRSMGVEDLLERFDESPLAKGGAGAAKG